MPKVQRYLNEKGFSLIELMTVVIIISILILIAVPVYKYTKANSQEKACQANQRIVEGAVVMWAGAESGREVTATKPTWDDLKPYWKGEPQPVCPLDKDSFELRNGQVTCPNGHPHY